MKSRDDVPHEMRQKIKTMYMGGYSQTEIAETLHLPKKYVTAWLTQFGFTNDEKLTSKCYKCVYGSSQGYCNYVLIARHKRNSPVAECDKYVEGERIKCPNDDFGHGCIRVEKDWLYTQAQLDL